MRDINHESVDLILKIKDLTGITEHALARKIGVDVEVLRGVVSRSIEMPNKALAVLRDFYEQAATSSVRKVAPRVLSLTVEEGVYCGDGLAFLATLPSDSIDSIVSDIPYGISLDAWDILHDNTNTALLGSSDAQQKAGRVFEKRRKPINGWSAADRDISRQYYAWCMGWAGEWMRVLKPGGSVLVFAGRRMVHRCVMALEDSGFNYRDMLAWLKPKAVMRAQPLSTVLRRRGELAEAERWKGWRVGNLSPIFEPIIWCFKPYERTLADNVLDYMVGAMNAEAFKGLNGSYANQITVGFALGEGGHHEAQKPVALMERLIELCTPPDGVVLDPFAGSGTTGVAAVRRSRRYVLVERDPKLCAIIQQRIEEAKRT